MKRSGSFCRLQIGVEQKYSEWIDGWSQDDFSLVSYAGISLTTALFEQVDLMKKRTINMHMPTHHETTASIVASFYLPTNGRNWAVSPCRVFQKIETRSLDEANIKIYQCVSPAHAVFVVASLLVDCSQIESTLFFFFLHSVHVRMVHDATIARFKLRSPQIFCSTLKFKWFSKIPI